MINFLIIIYTLILLSPLWKKKENWFTPPILFCITMSFYSLPDAFEILAYGCKNYTSNLRFNLFKDADYVVCRYFIVQILLVVSYYKSFKYFSQKSDNRKTKAPIDIDKKLNKYLFIIFLFAVTLFTFWYLNNIGGISGMLASFSNRGELLENRSIMDSIAPILVTFATGFLVKYFSQASKVNWFYLGALIIIGSLVYSFNGGRSQLVVFAISILCYWNFLVKKVNLLSLKLWPLYVVLIVIIISFQLLRSEDTGMLSSTTVIDNSDTLFNSMAYAKTQILIQNYFDKFDYWYGSIFSFLLYIFIPRSLYAAKPHIDEGDYIYNMIECRPNVLNDTYFVNSWPPFTAGISYANFGIVGVILGGILLGYIHSRVYKNIKYTRYSVFSLVLYVFVVLKFQITIFYIANLIYLLIEIEFFKFIYKKISHQKSI